MKKDNNQVYHSSIIQGLKVLRPNTSTHGENWIYATTTIEMSAAFLSGKGGDLSCQVGRDISTGKIFICERFKDSFDYRYNNYSGSIYILPKDKFVRGKTGWDEEVICNEEVEILKEIKVNNVKSYILNLIEEEKIILLKYPNKNEHIPEDDEDLVYRGIIWSRQFGRDVLDDFKKLHPKLVSRIEEGLKNGKYLDEYIQS